MITGKFRNVDISSLNEVAPRAEYKQKNRGEIMNIHDIDQAMAGFRDIAELLYHYKEQLIKQGFTEEQAMRLVVSYQVNMFKNNN